jgi:hypothetical protein
MTFLAVWHDYSTIVSLIAAIAGLGLLFLPQFLRQKEDMDSTERVLFMMSFSYWLVYCSSVLVQKLPLPDCDVLQMSLKITAIISYFLTFACILSLPLNRIALSQPQVEE